MKVIHAVLTFVLGFAMGITWLRMFWNQSRCVPAIVLLAPVAAGILGLSLRAASNFSFDHWAGGFSLTQAVFNILVVCGLLVQRMSACCPTL